MGTYGTYYTNYWGTMWDSKWGWSSKFAYFPRRLDSGQWIWFKEYYHGVRMIHGPELPVYLYQYMSTEEFIWEMLKQES